MIISRCTSLVAGHESLVEIYPAKTRVPFVRASKFKIYGPVGGIAASNGKVFVSHRDVNDMGVITAFTYDGKHSTVSHPQYKRKACDP